MKAGDLVDDSTVYETLKTHLAADKTRNGFILDGFPRTEQQIPMLEKLAGELSLDDYVALDISVPAEVTRTRLLQRGRADDTPEVIEARLERYENTAAPILSYFTELGKLRVVDGAGNIEQVAKKVRELF
jgi:adenylate kinase